MSSSSNEQSNLTADDAQANSTTHPEPPPFNPIQPRGGKPDILNDLGASVLPELIKVYENLTQQSNSHNDDDPSSAHLSCQPQETSFDAHQYPPAPDESQLINGHTSHSYSLNHFPVPPGSYEGSHPPFIPPVPQNLPSLQSHHASSLSSHESSSLNTSTHDDAEASKVNKANNNIRSLRKRSLESKEVTQVETSEKNGSKARKKGQNTDGRWSKRFTWPDDLHRDFVSAIFDVGLKHSSPSSILEHMPKSDHITTERIKSHLQKYRMHRAKSKSDFMTCYDASLSKLQTNGGRDKNRPLADGEVAAHLSYSTITDADTTFEEVKQEEVQRPQEPEKPKDTRSKLIIPQLTEEEKQSPVGTSLGYLIGLFFSLREQLYAQRAAQAAANQTGGALPISPDDEDSQDLHGFATAGGWEAHGRGGLPFSAQESPNDHQKAVPSTRTNLEQNKKMKQEMEVSRIYQGKFRDLKEREVIKCTPQEMSSSDVMRDQFDQELEDDFTPNPVGPTVDGKKPLNAGDVASHSQGAGEGAEAANAGDKGRDRAMSMGQPDDFWNADVLDEHLFEFLLNP